MGARAADPAVPGARRADRPPAAVGWRAPRGDLDPARPADRRPDARAGDVARRAPANGDSGAVAAVAERAGGNPFFAEEMARRLADEAGGEVFELPDTVQGLLAARLDSLEPARARARPARGSRGPHVLGGIARRWRARARPRPGRRCRACRRRTSSCPDVGVRLAGEREYSFKHVLIRDVAYGMLPKAVRARKHFDIGRFLEDRAGERTEEVVALLAEHFGRAAILTTEGGMEGVDAEPIHRKALHYLEAAGDAAAALYSNPEAFEHYEAAQKIDCPHDPGAVARVIEKQADVAFRMGRVGTAVELWEKALEFHRQQEDLTRVADLHRKIGAGLWNRGERKQAIERYQKGINLLKDGPPCLELVHLYEEAASLYMHAGDNMLAIYASEKALRLAEKLQETRVASRAHGIFGRVFGRIGDTAEGAREPRALGRARARLGRRGDDPRAAHARAPPRGLGGRLRRRGSGLRRGARARAAGRRPAGAGGAAVLDRPGGRLPCSVGRGRGGRRGERRPRGARGPGRQALLPVRAARRARLARGPLGGRRAVVPARARAGGAGRLVRGVVRGPLLAGARAARQRRLHSRDHRARSRARRVRARRPDRAVDRGDVGARHHARDRRQEERSAARRRRRRATSPIACTIRSATRPR